MRKCMVLIWKTAVTQKRKATRLLKSIFTEKKLRFLIA